MEVYRNLPLRWVTVAVAILIAAVWIGGLLAPEKFRRAALKFPRSELIGAILMFIGAIWCTWIVWQASPVNLLAPKIVGYWIIWGLCIGSILFKLEFIAVRALSAVLLLTACVMVNSAFMVETSVRLIIPSLAYVWVIAGMWWTITPWRCRNAIEWMAINDARTKAVSGAHLALAIVLLVLAFAFY